MNEKRKIEGGREGGRTRTERENGTGALTGDGDDNEGEDVVVDVVVEDDGDREEGEENPVMKGSNSFTTSVRGVCMLERRPEEEITGRGDGGPKTSLWEVPETETKKREAVKGREGRAQSGGERRRELKRGRDISIPSEAIPPLFPDVVATSVLSFTRPMKANRNFSTLRLLPGSRSDTSKLIPFVCASAERSIIIGSES